MVEDKTLIGDEDKTSQKASEVTDGIDLTKYVSVEEHNKLVETNKQLYSRLSKLKDKGTEQPDGEDGKSEEKKQPSANLPVDDLDKIEFFSQGGTKDDYLKLQGIMKGFDLSFEDAKESEVYKAYLEKRESQKKKEQSQLPPSRGGRQVQPEDIKPGMSEDEHKKMWAKKMGRA